jgi:acyl-[acyl-carrier-protein] desaturase
MYHIYLDFLQTAENKRRWNIFKDIPWHHLDAGKVNKDAAEYIEIYCAEEMYVPDYSARGLELSRSDFGTAWFQTCWAFEESKHALAFRLYLTRSGLRSEAQFQELENATFSKRWQLPFTTGRQMACYGALQEGATYTAYNEQRNRARCAGDEVLEAIFFFVGRDEAAHAGFYRSAIQLELSLDRRQTIADLALVLCKFKMPGETLIPDYRRRLQNFAGGISPRLFMQRVLSPLLGTLGISREEFKAAVNKRAQVDH